MAGYNTENNEEEKGLSLRKIIYKERAGEERRGSIKKEEKP